MIDGQARYFRGLGYEVYLISQKHYKEQNFCQREGITHLPVDVDKTMNPLKDFKALFQIINHFKRVKPDIVNVGTPKMGLLGIMAAWLAGVKTRIYTCRGLRFETEVGFTRWLLKATEKITVKLASKVIYVSPSLLTAAQSQRTYDDSKSVTLGNGSSNGVDIGFYNRSNIVQAERKSLIEKYGLEGRFIIGFVGRVSKEKGAYELVGAFEEINSNFPETRLIMMGHIMCEANLERRLCTNPSIIHIPFQDNVPLYMSIFDVLVLPSWREGFPNVPIQAAAMGIPVIVSDATGCIDSINQDVNGKMIEVKNVPDLRESILFYLKNRAIRQTHGLAGIEWAKQFRNELVWDKLHALYIQLS